MDPLDGNVDTEHSKSSVSMTKSQPKCQELKWLTYSTHVLCSHPRTPQNTALRVIGPIQQCGQIKIVPINISQTPKVKMAHQQHARSTQPYGNLSRHCWEVHIPRLQHGMPKIKCLNNKKLAKPQTIEMAHLECASAAQSHGKALNHVHGVNRPSRRRGRPKIKQISISQVQNSEVTHLEHTHTAQPHRSLLKCSYRVIGPKRWCRWPKITPTNVSPMQNGKTAYLGCDQIVQPCGDDPQHLHRVYRSKHQCRQLKTQPRSISQKCKKWNAHLGCVCTTQPCRNASRHSYEAIGPKRWHRRIKFKPRNIRWRETKGNAYQGLYKPTNPLPCDPDDPAWSTTIRCLLNSLQSLKNNLQNVSSKDNKSIRSYTHLSVNGSTICNTFIVNMWLTKSSNITAVSNLHNKTQTLEHGLPIYLESLSTHSFDI